MPHARSRLLLCLALSGLLPAQAQTSPVDSTASTTDPAVASDASVPDGADRTPVPAADAVKLEAVTVTGEKLRRSETDTATSVGIRNGRQVDESSMQTLEDLASRMANVGVSQGLTIRGIPLYGATGGDGKVAVITIDGVPQEGFGQGISSMSVWDTEQAEVLRGPQSTNQGRNSLAGAVVLKTRDPTDRWDLRTRVSGGTQDSTRLAFAGGGPLLPGLAAFRISVERNRSDGFSFNETRDDERWNHNDNQTVRAKLRLTPVGDAYKALITLSDARSGTGDGYVEATLRDANDRISLANSPAYYNNRTKTAALEQTLNWRAFDFTLLSSYLDSRYDRIGDYDETEQPLGENQGRSSDHMFSQEARAAFHLPVAGRELKGVFGVYYSDQDSTNFNGYTLPLYYGLFSTGLCAPAETLEQCAAVFSADPEHLVARTDNNDTRVRNRAVFFEADYPFGPVTLTVGGRYDREQQDRRVSNDTSGNDAFTQGLLDMVGFGPEASPPINTDYEAWLPKLGLRYRFAEDWVAGLTWQRAYRAGGISYSYLPTSIGGGPHDYGPEFTTNYELSLKGRPLPRLTVGLNAYRIDWRDQQVNIGTSVFDTRIVNAGSSRLHGLELEARGQALAELEVFGALGLSRTRYLEFSTPDQDYSGNQFERSPRVTASTGLSWKPDAWTINADVVYEGGNYSSADNDESLRNHSHALVNGKVAYQLANGARLFAYGLNLLDRHYTTYRLETVAGRQAAYLGDGQVVGVGLEWRFTPRGQRP